MPNLQVHVAIGMIGALVIISVISIFYRNKKLFLFIPLIILIGSFISIIPDIGHLEDIFPSVANVLNIHKEDRPAWNRPIFNICFFHPYLDSKFGERYDNVGLILTLLVYNGISLFYFYLAKNKTSKENIY